MVNKVAQKKDIKLIIFGVHIFGIYILAHSLLDNESSSLLKYGCFLFFAIEKLIGLKNSISNPSLENLIENIFHLDINILKSNQSQRKYRLSLNIIYFLPSLILAIFEMTYFNNSSNIYFIYILSCAFLIYLIFYQDWIAAFDALWVQYMVLSMIRLFYLKYTFKEVTITISCELILVYFAFIAAFDQKENIGSLNLKEITLGLILSLAFGITLPFNLNKKEQILKDKIFKILGQTQGFFSIHILFTLKSLFYEYSLFTRIGIIIYLPIFGYRLFRQFNFFTSGPYITSLEISCNSYTKIFRQISDEVIQCKIIFQDHHTNWACDQMDLLMKINPNVLFTYELHHGALVSEINYEYHNRNNVLSVEGCNMTILIFALYIYTISSSFKDLVFYFDISKFRNVPQYELDFYLIRYPFVRFYSKQLNYDGEEIPFQYSPLVKSFKRDAHQHVVNLILFEKYMKSQIKQFRYDIFCDLNNLD